jgi:dipeptidyl aminopeptidase/acylaminoacyl peptidase
VSLGGRSRPVRLTAGNKAYDSRPAFSRDGKQLAYVAMARPGYESDRTRLFVMDWASRKSRALTEAWDRSVDELAWSHDGRSIYVTADHVGNRALFAVDASDGVVTVLEGKGHCADVRALPDGVLYSHDTFSTPAELFARRQAVQRITEHNTARVAALAWGQFEQFQFKGAHGDTVHGYLVRPPGHRGEKVPVAVLVHGGPQGSFDNHFHYRWNAQAFAGRGYATVIIDFHGSTGYGQAFTDAIRGDWGGAPFQDIMLGLDHLLARHKFLDGNRMAALGGSYGGYMINWINGNTQRFKALVAHASNIDETMAYYQTEELWFPEWERQGTPWDNPQAYAKHNPLSLVHRWRTPTLVIHGARDYRVVDTQGMAVFTALQRRGIPSRLLYFPEENHWILAPQNVQLWYREVLGWLDRHVRGTARAAVHRS